MQPDRVLRVDVDAVAHGLLGPVGVAPVYGCEVAHARDGVIEDLGPEVTGEIGAGRVDRVRRADVGPRRHGDDVGGLGDEEPGRGGAGAARIDVGDHRDARVEQVGDDLVHGGGDAARRVDHHQESVRVVRLGAIDRGFDVGGHDVVDVPVEVHLFHVRGGCGRVGRQEHGGDREHEPPKPEGADPGSSVPRAHVPSMPLQTL